jgi:hypothetical protein
MTEFGSTAGSSIEDELDKISIDQLHANVLSFSKNCFEVKKLCLTVLVSASVLMASFTDDALDHALFVGGLIVISFFWVLDAQTYYLQRFLRHKMRELEAGILARNGSEARAEGIGVEVEERFTERRLRLRSYFNESMAFYALLAAIDVAIWALFAVGVIESS